MRLSQGQLTLLETCPRKFQHTYLEQLGAPTSPEQQEKLLAGSQFHQLMQQWDMGLTIEAFLHADPALRQWFAEFSASAPKILALADQSLKFRQSEHLRTLEWSGHLFTVVYDLLLLTPESAQILDWKTYAKPQQADRLTQNWQSRLYPFVLAETSDYRAEQISFTYWFFQTRSQTETPQCLQLSYTPALHQQTRQDLTQLLSQLSQWLDRYETQAEPFPQVPESTGHCEDCGFALRCQRGRARVAAEQESQALWQMDAIVEVPL